MSWKKPVCDHRGPVSPQGHSWVATSSWLSFGQDKCFPVSQRLPPLPILSCALLSSFPLPTWPCRNSSFRPPPLPAPLHINTGTPTNFRDSCGTEILGSKQRWDIKLRLPQSFKSRFNQQPSLHDGLWFHDHRTFTGLLKKAYSPGCGVSPQDGAN